MNERLCSCGAPALPRTRICRPCWIEAAAATADREDERRRRLAAAMDAAVHLALPDRPGLYSESQQHRSHGTALGRAERVDAERG